jgi:hypothetical protein
MRYHTENYNELVAQGPFVGSKENKERERDRQYSLRVELNTIKFHQIQVAEQQKVFDSLLAQV